MKTLTVHYLLQNNSGGGGISVASILGFFCALISDHGCQMFIPVYYAKVITCELFCM